MAYVRKTKDIYEVQGLYSGEWATLTYEDTYREACDMLRCYRENEPQYPHAIVKRRVKIEN